MSNGQWIEWQCFDFSITRGVNKFYRMFIFSYSFKVFSFNAIRMQFVLKSTTVLFYNGKENFIIGRCAWLYNHALALVNPPPPPTIYLFYPLPVLQINNTCVRNTNTVFYSNIVLIPKKCSFLYNLSKAMFTCSWSTVPTRLNLKESRAQLNPWLTFGVYSRFTICLLEQTKC